MISIIAFYMDPQHNTHGGKSGSPLDAFQPTQLFIGGIVVGFLVLCTIGFFILLGIVLKGGVSLSRGAADTAGGSLPTSLPSLDGDTQPPAGGPIRPVDEKRDHIRGAKKAKVTIVEYSDFECPFCGNFSPTVKQVLDEYPNDVRLVYRHFPLRSIHPEAAIAAGAAECASEQGKFWEFHDALFDNQARLGDGLYKEIAQNLKLNMSKFNDCLSSDKYASLVQEDESDGIAAGINGTPHSVVIGPDGSETPLRGALPYSQVKAVVDAALNS